jgi:ABC-type nitrate/sulfonate/bicarbonate transport system ATPase subunit
MTQFEITEPLLLDVDIELFEYQKGKPILKNIKQQVWNVRRTDVAQGQVVALLGPSGIGKSTLFELIAGLRKAQKGVVKTYHEDKKDLVAVDAGMVGVVYQSYDLFPFLTVKSQLELGAKKGNLPNAAEKIEFYIKHFGLMEHANKYPNQLSGGQKQRLAIAQQLLCSNNVLLMDEPFSGLDPVMKRKMCELIADIAQLDELMTIIIVSHDIEPTLSIADTVWLMGKTDDGAATIEESINLMEKGLCWDKNIQESRPFQELCAYVNKRFVDLGN